MGFKHGVVHDCRSDNGLVMFIHQQVTRRPVVDVLPFTELIQSHVKNVRVE